MTLPRHMPVVFTDCETTSLESPIKAHGRRPWEIAVVRLEPVADDHPGPRPITEHRMTILDVDLSDADPRSLAIGRFWERHPVYNGTGITERLDAMDAQTGVHEVADTEHAVALHLCDLLADALVFSATCGFDLTTYEAMLHRNRLPVGGWNYHTVDITSYAAGWTGVPLPTSTSAVRHALDFTRSESGLHDALEDARDVRKLYERVELQRKITLELQQMVGGS